MFDRSDKEIPLAEIQDAKSLATPAAMLRSLATGGSAHVRSAVAHNANTSADILGTLSNDNDIRVLSAVAGNENTNRSTFERLLGNAEKLVDSYLKERELLSTAPPPHGESDAEVRQRALLPTIWALSANPATPTDVLHQISGRQPRELAGGLLRGGIRRKTIRGNLLHNPQSGTVTAKRLLGGADLDERISLATGVATPPNTLAVLADDRSMKVRRGVACNRLTPPLALDRLAGDPHRDVRAAAARSTRCSEEALSYLAVDGHIDVRRAAAANRSTPPVSLDMLAAAPETVMFVAGNPNCPPSTLASIATSVCSPALPDLDADSVRRETCAQLARNRSTPADALRTIANFVAGDSASGGHMRMSMLESIAENPAAPPDVLDVIATSGGDRLRGAVASNPSAAEATLRALSSGRGDFVCSKLVGNLSCPEAVLRTLAEEMIDDLRYSLASSRAAPSDILRDLARDPALTFYLAANTATPSDVLSDIARMGKPKYRARVAANVSAPPGILATLAAADDPEIRALVASNPATPTATQQTLCGDPSAKVRAAIVQSPELPGQILEFLRYDESELVYIGNAPDETLESWAIADIPGL